ncbi:MAG: accessory gene regulator B family protein [Clostridia bacterium]|nr:accessory gene regulator B family protein [Clostridia bacterium]
MVEKICDFLMKRVYAEMPDIDDERAEVIRYGFELIIGEVPKMIVLFLLALVLGKIKYFIISMLIICPYRSFSGGIHLRTHIACFLSTTFLYLGNVLISELFEISNIYVKITAIIGVYIFSIVMIILYAPADTDYVPILRKKDRKNGKIKSIIWITLVLGVSIFVNDSVIANMCIVGVFIQTLTIMKVSYKIFNVKLGYLEYEKGL